MEGLEALRDADEATARDIAAEIGQRLREVPSSGRTAPLRGVLSEVERCVEK